MKPEIPPSEALKQLERVPSREPRKHAKPRTGSKPTQGETTMKPERRDDDDSTQQD